MLDSQSHGVTAYSLLIMIISIRPARPKCWLECSLLALIAAFCFQVLIMWMGLVAFLGFFGVSPWLMRFDVDYENRKRVASRLAALELTQRIRVVGKLHSYVPLMGAVLVEQQPIDSLFHRNPTGRSIGYSPRSGGTRKDGTELELMPYDWNSNIHRARIESRRY